MLRRANDRMAVLGWIAAAVLVAANLVLYAKTAGFEFVNYDDNVFLYQNPHVAVGLTAESVRWALTSNYLNWQPLVWLSHMAAVAAFGLNPGPHHVINFTLHALNAALLFLLLRRMTGALWPSAIAAALYSLHPLRVQSVAWVTERKDVLSTFFWLLAMWFYLDYVARPRPRRRYWLTVAAFAFGLMAKPMVVTLPFVLLLVDYWPLRRNATTSWRQLIQEKIPLGAMSLVSMAITFAGQSESGAVGTVQLYPLALRLQNALISYVAYLGDTLWPANLVALYEYPSSYPPENVLAAAVLLGGITWLAVRKAREWPWLITGWLWYLVTLLPVIGLVQVGMQSRADRYTYVPMLFLTFTFVWGCAELIRYRKWSPRPAVALGCALSIVLALAASAQAEHWRNSIALSARAVDVNPRSVVMRTNLGAELLTTKRVDEAIVQFDAALQIKPNFEEALLNMGMAYLAKQQPEQALPYLQATAQVAPKSNKAHYQTARALMALRRFDQAVAEYRISLALGVPPDFQVSFHTELGHAEHLRKNEAAALVEFNEVLRLAPNLPTAHRNAAIVLGSLGRNQEAVEHFAVYLASNPADSQTRRVMESLKAGAR